LPPICHVPSPTSPTTLPVLPNIRVFITGQCAGGINADKPKVKRITRPSSHWLLDVRTLL
jgi:hypothetical protein